MGRHKPVWLWVLFFVFLAICLAYSISTKALNKQKYDTVALVRAFVYKDGQLPKRDPRHNLIEDAAKAIDQNCALYGLDQALVAACIYAESSFDPKAIGFSDGETGVMQVHGSARRQCKVVGLDLTKLEDQIQCGSRWLSYLERSVCGVLFADKEKCLKKKDKRSCSGAMSAYISGSCDAGSKKIAKKVAYRLRLARWAVKETSPLLLY